jgi:hypothetical protein
MYYSQDGTLTPLGQVFVDSVCKQSILYRLVGINKSDSLLNEDILKIQNANTIPDVDGIAIQSLTQSRIVQVFLVVILFAVLVVGVGSFIMENRKMMGLLQKIHEKCKS